MMCNFEERPREEGGGRHLSCIFNLETSVGCARALSTTARSCGRAQHFSNAIYKRISQCVKVGFLAKISRISPTVLCSVQVISKISGKQDICRVLISDFCLNLRADVPSLEVPAGPRWSMVSIRPCTRRRACALQGSSSRRASRCLRGLELGEREAAGPRGACITRWAEERQW